MVAKLRSRQTFRVIAYRPHEKPIADRLPSVGDREALDLLEAMTNPRLQQEYAARKKVRPADLVGFDGNEMVIASFQYSGPSRFTDGSYGVYYAAYELRTAARESAYHTARFLAATNTRPTQVYKRALRARVRGEYDDVIARSKEDLVYDPDPVHYAAAQAYARAIYAAGTLDGILYRSVRDARGTCICIFRPNRINDCETEGFLMYTYDGREIDGIYRMEALA
jgi:hypothetical protein